MLCGTNQLLLCLQPFDNTVFLSLFWHEQQLLLVCRCATILDGCVVNELCDFDDGVIRSISSQAIVAEMKAGWNLGNSLDAEGPNETSWGNPVITRALIDQIAEISNFL